jgi:RNA polymerase sigma-70 factor (ECF subfamily)
MASSVTADDPIGNLILLVAKQDAKAFGQLYSRVGSKLMGVLIRMLGTSAEAEDALQEVFINVWLRAGSYDLSKGRGMTWLIALARHRAIDRLRQRPKYVSDDLALDAAVDPAPLPEARMIVIGEARRLVVCLAALEPDRAEAIRGAYLAGESYADLAVRFQVPLNTMRTWLRRSLLKLRECMDD